LDNNPVYKLRCRLFEYDSQALDTGVSAIDAIEDALTTQALIYQFTLEQSSAVNEDIRLEWGHSADAGLVIDETDGDNIIGQDDTTSVGESVLLENGSFLLNEEYIIGDMDQDKTAQNELFDELDDTILDFSETNPFGDAGST